MSDNRQIDVDFVNFIAEEVKNVKAPMILRQLCREFKKKTGTTYSWRTLQRIRDNMSEMENFDSETKVKMMYALGSPVSNGLLIELKRQADIELDERNRIIKYNSNRTDLQLSGVHDGRPCEKRKEKEMLKFLAEKSENATLPMTDTAFLKEFNSSDENFRVDGYTRYNLLKQQIYLTPEYDQQTKIKMIFVSNTKVHASILEELRQNAVVEVDEYQRITKYEANDGSLKLKGEHTKLRAPQGVLTEWSKEEREQLLSFVAEKSKRTKVPLLIKPLCREFIEKNGVSRTQGAVELNLYKHLIPKISKLDNFDIETKMRMLFTLGVPVDQKFLNKLRKEAVVEVDENQRITKYESNDGSLKLEGERKKLSPGMKPTLWSKEETDKLWIYIVEISKRTKVPLNIVPLSREFVKNNRVSRTTYAVIMNIRKIVRPKISKRDDVDMKTKVRMMFSLSVPVDEKFLNELRKEASVKVDEMRRITNYKANDGSLELNGDHSKSAKMKTIHTQKESNIVNSEALEIDDETGDYDDEEDDEEDVAEVSKPNTRSGRLPKRRYPDVDSFSDSDDDACKSSKSIKKTKLQKTKKITKKATSQIQKGRKHKNTYSSKTDEETGDEESEEEYKEGEEEKFEAKSFTRRSERISKNRYPDNEFTSDFNDVSFDSPENVNDSKIEKETEKLVEMPFDSSSEAPFVKNLKRKNVKNPSDVITSSLKLKRYENDVIDQNNTESDKIANGTEKNDDKESLSPAELRVKQEPLSYEEVQLENEEYKPDRSFLCGTIQDTMQSSFSKTKKCGRVRTQKDIGKRLESDKTVSETKQNDGEVKYEVAEESLSHKEVKQEEEEYKPDISFLSNTTQIRNFSDDVDPSAEDTDEITSGKEFMKLLRGLVDTLDSPILVELQSKIQKAIEKLGNEDHKIPIDDIVIALNSGLTILNKSATIQPSTGESTSLRDFLLILRSTLSTLHFPSLNKFQLKLKENIKKLNSQDKIIPVENVRPVLETVFLLALP